MRVFHEYWSRHETFSYGFRGTVPSYWNLRPVPFGQDDLFIYLNFAIKLGSYENGMDKLGNCFISLRAREYKDIISSKIGLDECWQLETQMGETAEPVKEVLSPNEVDDILAKIDSDFGPCTPDNPP